MTIDDAVIDHVRKHPYSYTYDIQAAILATGIAAHKRSVSVSLSSLLGAHKMLATNKAEDGTPLKGAIKRYFLPSPTTELDKLLRKKWSKNHANT